MKINTLTEFDEFVQDNEAYRRKCIASFVLNFLEKSHITNINAKMEQLGFLKNPEGIYTFTENDSDEIEKNLYDYAYSLGNKEEQIYDTLIEFGLSIEEIGALMLQQEQEVEKC